MLGLEQFGKPGSFGSSSFGETRLWRVTHGYKYKNDMMREAVKMWKEWEKESGSELIVQFPVLTMGSTANEHIVSIFNQYPDHKAYTPDEITEKYPALRNIPEDYKGIIHEECGIVRSRRALDVVDKLTREKYGADLKYDVKVTKVAKDSVTTSDGTVYSAKNVIVC